MSHIIEDTITFDDVLLVPAYSEVLPKKVSLNTQLTREISLKIPLLSAAMDSVTESNLAISMAQEGGVGIVHKNMSIKAQATEVRKVKKFENGMVIDPITAMPETTIHELLEITKQYHFSGVPVVKGKNLVGIVTSRDIRFVKDLSQTVANVMTPKKRLVTVKEGAQEEEIQYLLHQYRIEKILVVNDSYELVGLVTVKDIQKSIDKPNACKDELGRLVVGAAVGASGDTQERVKALVEANVDVIVIDTAHGHSVDVIKQIYWIKKKFPALQVIAGNIATASAAKSLARAGVDAIKVGVGPGSICTTRVVAGVGVPQLTAILNVSNALSEFNIPVIADGGIRYSGDICKAIAAGASSVMVGSLFAGTEEAPGEVELFQGRAYKSYRGMGSVAAMSKGSADRYFQEKTNAKKLVPEGVEGRVPYKGVLSATIHQLIGGLRAGMGYTGCSSIKQMKKKPKFVRVSSASFHEGHAHNVIITKEPPNYQR